MDPHVDSTGGRAADSNQQRRDPLPEPEASHLLAPALAVTPRRAFHWNRKVVLMLIGLTIGVALVFALSAILDASDYYAQQLAAAMPIPSGKR